MSASSSPTHQINVQTVYELASDIGEHFKKLIEQYGQEPNQKLIPSVVRVLEYLEEVVIQREDDLMLVDKLQRQIEELQGQHERTQQQIKHFSEFQSEIEDIDESWRNENIKLSQYVKFLHSENKRLASSLNEKHSHSLSDLHQDEEEEQLRQKHSANEDKLKKRISLLCKEIELKKDEIDTLKSQNDSLLEKNETLRNLVVTIRKSNNSIKSHTTDLIVEDTSDNKNSSDKKDLVDKIKALEEEIEMYKRRLQQSEAQPSHETLSEALNDRNNNSEKVDTDVIEATEHIKMEALPVQGPIPKEPDFFTKDRKSRIWNFFPRFTRALIK